jgi:hypothetical protein
MSIPLISNIGFTEVNSPGNLNTKAGTAKSKLPIQLFKLTDNITGNLTLDNNSAHKKIILDTNGFTINNSAGSPLTTNSNIIVELKGSGNIQSTLKTFSSSVDSTSNIGTTTISEANDSTVDVSNVDTDTTVEKYIDTGGSFSYNGTTIDSQGTTTLGGSTPNAATIFGSGSSTQYNMNVTDGTQALVFVGDTSTSTNVSPASGGYKLYVATIQPNTVSQLRMDEYSNYNGSIGIYNSLVGGVVGGHNRYSGTTNHQLNYSGTRRLWWRYERTGNDRKFIFTNNLLISVVLTGNDPFDNITVTSGGTNTQTISNSTDGSFDVTGTISGNNGSGQPYALVNVNNGTGTLNTDNYTGTLSVRAF